MSERRRVNFRESPPSSGTSSRYTSDSGHGSVSDYPGSSAGGGVASSSTASSRYSGAVGNQWTDLSALQEAYRSLAADRDHWKNRTEELEQDVSGAQKQSSEAEAKWRAMVSRNEQIEEENVKLRKEIKSLKPLAEEIDELHDKVDELREQLADANARFNEMQHNVAPAFGPGTSPHNPGPIHGDLAGYAGHAGSSGHAESTKSSSRHSRDGKSSSSTKGGGGSSGSSSGSSGHSSSRAKVGSSSSTSTAKISRQGSKHDPEKEQKMRLSHRFDHHKDDGVNDSNASASSSAASSASHKHHKSGSSGNGSSASNGSSGSADSSGGRQPAPSSRIRRQSYVEGFGPPGPSSASASGQSPISPISPNKGIQRSAPPPRPSVAPGQSSAAASAYYGHPSFAPQLQPHFGAPPPSVLVSPRGDMSKDASRSIHPSVVIVDDTGVDPYHDAAYYNSYAGPRDPRHPRR